MKIKLQIFQIVATILVCSFMFSCHSDTDTVETSKRTKININKNCHYLENDTKQNSEALKDNNWIPINLPHSWNSIDATDVKPGYRRSGSWYKKTLIVDKIQSDKIYDLYFEGVNITSEVYINSTKVGGHIAGYIGFTIDISKNLKSGANEIVVRADKSYNPEIIPSQKSDFFIFGGITRDVWLNTLPFQHLYNLKITIPNVSHENADLLATFGINNSNNNSTIKARLINQDGKEIQSQIFYVSDSELEINFNQIKNLKLWDADNPNLNTLNIQLLENDKVIDEISENVGFRWFEFKDHGAFYINGKRLLLRGAHRHEEHAGFGAAMSNEQHSANITFIKDMGVNFVRLAHYPQDPEVYKACDELRLLVWDELPWCRGGLGNTIWKINTINMLEEIINQNYNHPSIILWSLGNEIYWLPDFKNGDDTDKINTYLNEFAHKLDPTRKTAIRKYYEGADIVDVFSPSIWSSWYSGSYKNYKKAIDLYQKKYLHFIHAEYGGSSHVGRHTENSITGQGKIQTDGWEEANVQTDVANIAQTGDWSENYIVDLFDWHLHISENDTTFTGNAKWAFKDFGIPLRPENAIP